MISFLMGCPLEEMTPFRTCSTKIRKNGTGSLNPARSAGIHIQMQNTSHLCQVVESLRSVEADNPAATTFYAAL